MDRNRISVLLVVSFEVMTQKAKAGVSAEAPEGVHDMCGSVWTSSCELRSSDEHSVHIHLTELI